MTRDEPPTHSTFLVAYINGDLDEQGVSRVDRHLVDCDLCWDALREDRLGRQAAHTLRENPPDELAERVRFAVELASGSPGGVVFTRLKPRQFKAHIPRFRRSYSAALASIALVLGGLLTHELLDPMAIRTTDAVAVIANMASHTMPEQENAGSETVGGVPGDPVEVGRFELRVQSEKLQVSRYVVGKQTVLVAAAPGAFPMPDSAKIFPAAHEMAWSASESSTHLFCITGTVNALLASSSGEVLLPRVAQELGLLT